MGEPRWAEATQGPQLQSPTGLEPARRGKWRFQPGCRTVEDALKGRRCYCWGSTEEGLFCWEHKEESQDLGRRKREDQEPRTHSKE